MANLVSPYPYFGGKSGIMQAIWDAIGDVPCFVDPFLGSMASVLGRPSWHKNSHEVANDKDGYISNFWRAMQYAPDEVAYHADNLPTFETELHANHLWLLKHKDELPERLMGDETYYDAKIAGVWAWGISLWIGSGFCSGNGPWISANGKLTNKRTIGADDTDGIGRQLPMISSSQGIHKKRLHVMSDKGIQRQILIVDTGKGIGRASLRGENRLTDYFHALAKRLKNVRVMCGDWTRVIGPSVVWGLNERDPHLTGVFLDPPYNGDIRTKDIYTVDDHNISSEVAEWAIKHGDNPNMRIVMAGYEHEHTFPTSWRKHVYSVNGGYGNQAVNGRGRDNKDTECLWFSPYCIKPFSQFPMFSFEE